ncbi:glutamate mutase L [Salmonella enterica]|uniref:Glutamate mutase n=1 Tax=Salmonella enterica TaxID=28901 RepID=A0A763ST25_SALER|nr:methylaspartate mutase accessory protein GlmL [Salmonella enterica]EAC0474734.1 glutamate mutase [Salmonella enterica subsp. enterica serovar Tornow]EBR9811871.1 glutamate mutase [Salmonella enterica subsp. enterica serovar Teshie]ECA1252152.1 glutamate mutase [Salmonella enterica subsp. enterica serovar Chailey]ECD6620304.1 glutamate mutase [Salmonella enterica subsp. enterica]ECE5745873.1 glutamate mutase [Salmonella enterica subsp. salamae]HBL9984735.1 glutamate mutase L [Salmonella ent
MQIVSVDIGSTWTKAALFAQEGDALTLVNHTLTPTTTHHLADGFFASLNQVLNVADARPRLKYGDIQLKYSSSAKGGLAVAAMGLVPSITLESAKVTAHSAGAKIAQYYAYKLNRHDIAELEASPPDILLFTGGTDGGEESYGLANARALAESTLDCAIIYAGNRDIQDEVQRLLNHKDLITVDNILPDLDHPNPYAARQAICDVFLSRIVKGKGLDVIVSETGEEPMPTPWTVYELVKAISDIDSAWKEFMLIDMGGATTDVYSACANTLSPDTVLHGVPEPFVKRTVEGDLGMRVSAVVVGESTEELVKVVFAQQPERQQAFYHYLRHLTAQPDYLPRSEEEKDFDTLLAGLCVGYASERHAGTKKQVCTCVGNVDLQMGRDLTTVRKVIGSGGWLSRASQFDIHRWLKYRELNDDGKSVLLPNQFDYYRDSKGLLPLLANVARLYPQLAARTSIHCLTR